MTMATLEDAVLQTIAPVTHDLGDFKVNRILPARARVLMGTLWGATAATPQHSPTIYADIELARGGSLAIEAEADERAVMLVGGDAELDGRTLDLFTLYVLHPRHQARLSSAAG